MVTSTGGIDGAAWNEALEFGRRVGGLDDEALGDAIEAHGREAVEHDRPIALAFYLAALPGLHERAVPLDAAIDVALRWLVHRGHTAASARDRLVRSHPGLAGPIDEAALLGQALVATSDLRRRIDPGVRALPCEFGPAIGQGRCRFELVEFLGAGAGGHVYRAVDRTLSDRGFSAVVAVKVFDAVDASSWARERFVEEASKARRVRHLNVVRVLDRDVSDAGEDFIVYEYVEGGTLEDWARGAARGRRDLVRVASGIARGVQAAHSAGVVHCDLKPANILMTSDGEPRIADFGVAVRREAWAEKLDTAATDRPVGNLAFISPEQYRMEPGSLSPVSDVYAAGGLLHWLLTGTLPNGDSLAEIERRHGDPAAPPPMLGSGADRDLRAICSRALARDPGARYQSAAQLADDLDSWLAREPIRWTGPSPIRVFSLWTRRRPGLAATLAVLAVVGAGSTGAILRLREAAAASRVAAAAASERVRVRDEEKQNARKELVRRFGKTAVVMAMNKPWEMLALAPYFDWMLGTSVFGDPGDDKPIWINRVALIGRMLDSARAREGDTGLETLLLETTLGFWLLTEHRPAEAGPLLERNRAGWHSLLADDAAPHRWGRVLRAVAEVQTEVEAGRAGQPACLAATERLRAEAAMLSSGPSESLLLELVKRTLDEARREAPAPSLHVWSTPVLNGRE
ncbi:MAG: serine/threonine protein kinase [Phycisphaerales bacterium]|nr:serine/threonine protein kinase [Phycisphaerales bacterium]